MITAIGKCMGVRVDEFTNKQTGEVRITKRVGIGMKKDRGYEEDLHIFEITLDKDTSADAEKRLNSLKGRWSPSAPACPATK